MPSSLEAFGGAFFADWFFSFAFLGSVWAIPNATSVVSTVASDGESTEYIDVAGRDYWQRGSVQVANKGLSCVVDCIHCCSGADGNVAALLRNGTEPDGDHVVISVDRYIPASINLGLVFNDRLDVVFHAMQRNRAANSDGLRLAALLRDGNMQVLIVGKNIDIARCKNNGAVIHIRRRVVAKGHPLETSANRLLSFISISAKFSLWLFET